MVTAAQLRSWSVIVQPTSRTFMRYPMAGRIRTLSNTGVKVAKASGNMPWSFIEKVCAVVVVVGFLNFVVFVAVAGYLGGTAVNGCVNEGHYYLADNRGLRYTEVNKPVFTYSKWHFYSNLLTWPLMFVAGPYLYKKRIKNFDPTFDELARHRGRKLLDQ